jgi:gluconate 2-dehydrogenase gamma chain
MSPPEPISRREAVRRLSVLAGGTLSGSTTAALLSGCRAEPRVPGWTPEALTPVQLDVLTAVVDGIIPRSDTPGASDVGVPVFIDRLLSRWAEDGARERVLTGLDELGTEFLGAGEERRLATLTTLDEEAAQAREARRADDTGDTDEPLPFFATLKEWTLSGYYTSEAGATQELQWLAIPGRYDADAPLGEVGRAWA